jgi:putrescine---pyruvate transaminase
LGILFVADEVITGFGRTGPLFACEEDEIALDFMTTAKGLTSAYVPMGAVFMADHVYQTIADGVGAAAVGHGYTYRPIPSAPLLVWKC